MGNAATVRTVLHLNEGDRNVFDELRTSRELCEFILETDEEVSRFSGTVQRVIPSPQSERWVQVEIEGGFLYKQAIKSPLLGLLLSRRLV